MYHVHSNVVDILKVLNTPPPHPHTLQATHLITIADKLKESPPPFSVLNRSISLFKFPIFVFACTFSLLNLVSALELSSCVCVGVCMRCVGGCACVCVCMYVCVCARIHNHCCKQDYLKFLLFADQLLPELHDHLFVSCKFFLSYL